MPEFHFGRFNVRFRSAPERSTGRGFNLMEVNGADAGAEAIQVRNPNVRLADGFRMIFAKQRLLFAIGAPNRRRAPDRAAGTGA